MADAGKGQDTSNIVIKEAKPTDIIDLRQQRSYVIGFPRATHSMILRVSQRSLADDPESVRFIRSRSHTQEVLST